MEDVAAGEAEGCLEVWRGEDLLAHDARLEPGRVLLHRVKDQVGVLLAEVLCKGRIRGFPGTPGTVTVAHMVIADVRSVRI